MKTTKMGTRVSIATMLEEIYTSSDMDMVSQLIVISSGS